MTIYYSLTFLLLASEMITFCAIVAPLPYAVRKRVFTFLSESPIVGKIAYGLKIAFIFVAVLFADALQRMFRITAEAEAAKASGLGAAHDIRAETNFAARKFYAQRNTYLTEYAKLKKETESAGKSGESVAELKKKLAAAEAKTRDFEILKKQSESQAQKGLEVVK
ncbi:endoplasmic reticulum [Pyrrhoderma noxium]|uniref:Endoplasmic reticulum transmembrane protein n=1 Tax=Pyrrhoderma noxium TaxID=2282107 RepID=A0A286U8M5_9AGAM|nr:endoplasmic reticulum [Pyrrhoderma noxium]